MKVVHGESEEEKIKKLTIMLTKNKDYAKIIRLHKMKSIDCVELFLKLGMNQYCILININPNNIYIYHQRMMVNSMFMTVTNSRIFLTEILKHSRKEFNSSQLIYIS